MHPHSNPHVNLYGLHEYYSKEHHPPCGLEALQRLVLDIDLLGSDSLTMRAGMQFTRRQKQSLLLDRKEKSKGEDRIAFPSQSYSHHCNASMASTRVHTRLTWRPLARPADQLSAPFWIPRFSVTIRRPRALPNEMVLRCNAPQHLLSAMQLPPQPSTTETERLSISTHIPTSI